MQVTFLHINTRHDTSTGKEEVWCHDQGWVFWMLSWSVSGQSTPVMLLNKSSVLDVVCHVAMCLVTHLAGTVHCATFSRSRGLRPPPLNVELLDPWKWRHCFSETSGTDCPLTRRYIPTTSHTAVCYHLLFGQKQRFRNLICFCHLA